MSTSFEYDDDSDYGGTGPECENFNNCDHEHDHGQDHDQLTGGSDFGYGYGFGNDTNATDAVNGTWALPTVLFMSVTSSILGLMILATIIGNVFVIVAVFKEKNLQSVANYLIVSLAVADLMVACLVMPMGALYSITGNNWILGPVLCDVWTSSDVLCCTASILHLVAIAVDRYWAVTDIEYIRSRNRSRINTMILLVWLVAVVVSIAPILGWKDPEFYVRVEVDRKCLVSQDVGYQIFATCATFYVPLCVILLLYWKIFQTARRRIRHRPGGAGSAGRPASKEKKVAIAEEISSTRVEGGNGSGEAASTIEQGEGAASRSSTSESHTHQPTTQSQSSPNTNTNTTNNNQANTKHHFHIQQQRQAQSPQSPTSPTTEDDDEDEEEDVEGGGGKKSETIESLIDATTTPEEYGEDEEMIGLDDGDEIHISTIHKTATSSFTTLLHPHGPNHMPYAHIQGHGHGQSTPANHMPESPVINVIEAVNTTTTTTTPMGSPPADSNNKAHEDGSGTIALETLSPSTLLTSCNMTQSSLTSPLKMLKPSSTIKKAKSTKESIEVKRERKAAKTLAIITGAFVMCWLPFFVMALLMSVCTHCWLPDWVDTSFLWLGYFNSTLNPIIYNVFSPEFRLAFKRILFGRNYGRRRRAK